MRKFLLFLVLSALVFTYCSCSQIHKIEDIYDLVQNKNYEITAKHTYIYNNTEEIQTTRVTYTDHAIDYISETEDETSHYLLWIDEEGVYHQGIEKESGFSTSVVEQSDFNEGYAFFGDYHDEILKILFSSDYYDKTDRHTYSLKDASSLDTYFSGLQDLTLDFYNDDVKISCSRSYTSGYLISTYTFKYFGSIELDVDEILNKS